VTGKSQRTVRRLPRVLHRNRGGQLSRSGGARVGQGELCHDGDQKGNSKVKLSALKDMRGCVSSTGHGDETKRSEKRTLRMVSGGHECKLVGTWEERKI